MSAAGTDERPTAPSMDFVRDPLRVALFTFFAPVVYFYWFFFQFFRLAHREQFPRLRGFWTIFLPFYGYFVLYQTVEDLERRLLSGKRGHFGAGAVIAMVFVGHVLDVFSIAFQPPFSLGILMVAWAFSAAATSSLQRAANLYLLDVYRTPRASGTRWHEVVAIMAGVAILGLGLTATVRLLNLPPPNSKAVVATASTPTPDPTPTPAPTPAPPIPPFPVSGNAFEVTADAGGSTNSGHSPIYDQTESFLVYREAIASPAIAMEIGGEWIVIFGPPAGRTLHVGNYENAQSPIPVTDAPGLSVAPYRAACLQVWGSFTITRIAFDSQGALRSLDATFVQHCDSRDAPALRGRLRFDVTG